MAKIKIILSLLLCSYTLPGAADTNGQRARIQAGYRAEIGINENTAQGLKRVLVYLNTVHVTHRVAWCAGFVSWNLEQNCVNNPHSALAADYFKDKKKIVYTRADGESGQVKTGSLFGIYFKNLGGIHHTGFIDQWDDDNDEVVIVAGNTNDAGSRTGGIVCRKIYTKDQIYIISDYIDAN